MLTLFYGPGACSMASHIVLEESGEKYEARRMDLANGEQRTESYLKIHPLGRVPALGARARQHVGEALAHRREIAVRVGRARGVHHSIANKRVALSSLWPSRSAPAWWGHNGTVRPRTGGPGLRR